MAMWTVAPVKGGEEGHSPVTAARLMVKLGHLYYFRDYYSYLSYYSEI